MLSLAIFIELIWLAPLEATSLVGGNSSLCSPDGIWSIDQVMIITQQHTIPQTTRQITKYFSWDRINCFGKQHPYCMDLERMLLKFVLANYILAIFQTI